LKTFPVACSLNSKRRCGVKATVSAIDISLLEG
jgi:hypothetical protein